MHPFLDDGRTLVVVSNDSRDGWLMASQAQTAAWLEIARRLRSRGRAVDWAFRTDRVSFSVQGYYVKVHPDSVNMQDASTYYICSWRSADIGKPLWREIRLVRVEQPDFTGLSADFLRRDSIRYGDQMVAP